jgi:hypothetical protein
MNVMTSQVRSGRSIDGVRGGVARAKRAGVVGAAHLSTTQTAYRGTVETLDDVHCQQPQKKSRG